MSELNKLQEKNRKEALDKIKKSKERQKGQAPLILSEEKPEKNTFAKTLKDIPTSVRTKLKKVKTINDELGIRTPTLTALMIDIAVLEVNGMLEEAELNLKKRND